MKLILVNWYRCRVVLLLMLIASAACSANGTECIAPAKPGGGFHITCELVQQGLQQTHAAVGPLSISYMPGGIGAVAYNAIITQRNAEPNTLIAFAGGSLLNIAEGKFGKYTEHDVKWLAAFGIDYGVLMVRADSPFTSLQQLVAALKKQPGKLVFGHDGTVGGPDWMKVTLLAHAASVDYKSIRFVGFEGSGEANIALTGGYVDVVSTDVSEAVGLIRSGSPVRILTVFSDRRLPGQLNGVPTAKESGYDVQWSHIRGVYMGPKVPEADYQRWVTIFNKMLSRPEFVRLRDEHGLLPFNKTGAELDIYVHDMMKQYRRLAKQVK